MKNFLKSDRHTHKDPQVRLTSLVSMDCSTPENQIIIEAMASNDDDESVRLAAVDKLATVTVLQRVLKSQDTNTSMAGAVETRIVSLLSDDHVSESEVNELLSNQDSIYAPLIAINSSNKSIRRSALSKLDNESVMVAVLEQTRFHDVRLTCAERLKSEDNIRLALRACRSKDKVVAKLLQSRIDEKEAAIEKQNAEIEAVATTLNSMRTLAESVWSPQYAGRYAALNAKWAALDTDVSSESQPQFLVAAEAAKKVINEHEQKVADKKSAVSASSTVSVSDVEKASRQAQASRTEVTSGLSSDKASDIELASGSGSAEVITPGVGANSEVDCNAGQQQSDEKNTTTGSAAASIATQTSPVVDKPDPQRDALMEKLKSKKLAELHKIDADKINGENPIEAGSDSEKLLAHAQSIGVLFDPPFDLAKGRPGAVTERIKRVKALLNTESILPGVQFDNCMYLEELKEHAVALENRLGKAKQESVDRAKATHRQFGALSSTISDGKWGPASSMFRRLQKKVDSMEPAERSQFTDKMARTEKQLAEMADWQDFAARPKLEALCVAIEALPAQELKPEALAKEIKSIQAQWKSLGASRASNDLWARFKTAGDTAYEPCKAHFASKQEVREAKQATKVALCDELEKQYKDIDWEAVDWKATQRLVNNAKRDWSRNRVSDRKPDRALEQRFSDVLKPFNEKLTEQYDANVLEKRNLIEKIQKLAEAEINQHSANQAKRLQSAWKQVGIVPRKDDQALWEEFNGHCKVIYKHQHEAQREKYQASMSHVFRAREIIKTLRKIAKSSDSSADSGDISAQVQSLQAEFQALEDFPDKDKKFLLRDFRGALDACSKLQENALKKRAQAEVNEIGRLVELCEQLESAVESAAESPDSTSSTLRDDVAHAWENASASVTRETLAKLAGRRDAALKHLDDGSQYDYEANEAMRRQLLIQMEILTDKDTPAEDKALRMQYQLEHLREGMTSSAVVDKRAELAKLVTAWYAAAPSSQGSKGALHSRFLEATNQ